MNGAALITDNLTVNGTITGYATQDSVNLKANTAEVETKLANKTEKSTTNTSAVAWSSGLASDGTHYIDTGSDALVIRTPSGAISANFFGNVGGSTYDGRAMFRRTLSCWGFEVWGGIKSNNLNLPPWFQGSASKPNLHRNPYDAKNQCF